MWRLGAALDAVSMSLWSSVSGKEMTSKISAWISEEINEELVGIIPCKPALHGRGVQESWVIFKDQFFQGKNDAT